MTIIGLILITFAQLGDSVNSAGGNRAGGQAVAGIALLFLLVTFLSLPGLASHARVGSDRLVILFLAAGQVQFANPDDYFFQFGCRGDRCVFIAIILTIALGIFGTGGVANLAAGGLVVGLQLLAALGWFAAFVLFMISLRNLAYYLKDEVTGDEAIRLMLFLITVTIVGPIFIFIIILGLGWIPHVGRFFVTIAGIAWLIPECKLIFGILNLISTIRQNIRTRW